jgi:hypothetical protein
MPISAASATSARERTPPYTISQLGLMPLISVTSARISSRERPRPKAPTWTEGTPASTTARKRRVRFSAGSTTPGICSVVRAAMSRRTTRPGQAPATSGRRFSGLTDHRPGS